MVADVGWPQLHWFVTEHLSKPPKDWLPPPRPSDNAAAYIEVMALILVAAVLISDVCTILQRVAATVCNIDVY